MISWLRVFYFSWHIFVIFKKTLKVSNHQIIYIKKEILYIALEKLFNNYIYIYDLCWGRLACQFWPLVIYVVSFSFLFFFSFCYVFMSYVVSMQYLGKRKFRGENCNCVTVGDNVSATQGAGKWQNGPFLAMNAAIKVVDFFRTIKYLEHSRPCRAS